MPMATPNFSDGVMLFRVTCGMFVILQLTYFLFQISGSALCQFLQLAQLQQSPVPLQFSLLDVVIATDTIPTHWAFYFQDSELPLSISGPWTSTMCRVHIALQELQGLAPSVELNDFLVIWKGGYFAVRQ